MTLCWLLYTHELKYPHGADPQRTVIPPDTIPDIGADSMEVNAGLTDEKLLVPFAVANTPKYCTTSYRACYGRQGKAVILQSNLQMRRCGRKSSISFHFEICSMRFPQAPSVTWLITESVQVPFYLILRRDVSSHNPFPAKRRPNYGLIVPLSLCSPWRNFTIIFSPEQ